MKASILRSVLKDMLADMGLDENNYNVHSFRGGRIVDLKKIGISLQDLKTLGRWRSNVIFSYLKNC